MLRRVDFHLLYMGIMLFVPATVLAIFTNASWPVWACAVFLQFPLMTRAIDKKRHGDASPYIAANELLVAIFIGVSVATMAVVKMKD